MTNNTVEHGGALTRLELRVLDVAFRGGGEFFERLRAQVPQLAVETRTRRAHGVQTELKLVDERLRVPAHKKLKVSDVLGRCPANSQLLQFQVWVDDGRIAMIGASTTGEERWPHDHEHSIELSYDVIRSFEDAYKGMSRDQVHERILKTGRDARHNAPFPAPKNPQLRPFERRLLDAALISGLPWVAALRRQVDHLVVETRWCADTGFVVSTALRDDSLRIAHPLGFVFTDIIGKCPGVSDVLQCEVFVYEGMIAGLRGNIVDDDTWLADREDEVEFAWTDDQHEGLSRDEYLTKDLESGE